MSKWQSGNRPTTQAEWEEAGADAILDLLSTRWVVPWTEAEARISWHGWKDFPLIQPLQLTAARRALIADGKIVYEATAHTTPVVTIRLPYPPGRQKALERLRGRRRKEYRKYLAWAEDNDLCGRFAERVVIETAQADATTAGLFVPTQVPGRTSQVAGVSVGGTFDAVAYVMDSAAVPVSVAALVFEVKNVNGCIYPWAQEIWELLVRAARIADQTPTVPVLVCVRAAWSTWQMAQDIGCMLVQIRNQLFSPAINATDFERVVNEFDLLAEQRGAPHEHLSSFFRHTLRGNPPSPPPEEVPFWERQLQRFQEVAPVVRRFEVLAKSMDDDARSRTFTAFKVEASKVMLWQRVRGW